ncbi:hypothetical protein K9M79_02965 [Candidatus Woesearchaeota archaeon]|nr:hypothetical protein [Candidatus Woesearchaeota archaeon]
MRAKLESIVRFIIESIKSEKIVDENSSKEGYEPIPQIDFLEQDDDAYGTNYGLFIGSRIVPVYRNFYKD